MPRGEKRESSAAALTNASANTQRESQRALFKRLLGARIVAEGRDGRGELGVADLEPLDDLVERGGFQLEELGRPLLDAARAPEGRADEPSFVLLDQVAIRRPVLRETD